MKTPINPVFDIKVPETTFEQLQSLLWSKQNWRDYMPGCDITLPIITLRKPKAKLTLCVNACIEPCCHKPYIEIVLSKDGFEIGHSGRFYKPGIAFQLEVDQPCGSIGYVPVTYTINFTSNEFVQTMELNNEPIGWIINNPKSFTVPLSDNCIGPTNRTTDSLFCFKTINPIVFQKSHLKHYTTPRTTRPNTTHKNRAHTPISIAVRLPIQTYKDMTTWLKTSDMQPDKTILACQRSNGIIMTLSTTCLGNQHQHVLALSVLSHNGLWTTTHFNKTHNIYSLTIIDNGDVNVFRLYVEMDKYVNEPTIRTTTGWTII